MKRQQDRDSPSKSSKRSRSSVPRFEDSPRDHLSPERERGPRSPSHGSTGKPSSSTGSRHGKNRTSSGTGSGDGTPDRHLPLSRTSHDGVSREPRDDYPRTVNRSYDKEYRILCVSGFNHRVSDTTIRDGVFREFKKFGDIDVKLVVDAGERLAYVYFRTAEDAREARQVKAKLIMFDKPIIIDPVFENSDRRGRSRNSASPESGGTYAGKMPRPRGISPSHSTSSSSSLQRRTHRTSLERVPLPPLHPHPHPPHHPHHHDIPFRRDGLPPPPLAHALPDFLPPHTAPPLVRRHEEKKEKFPNYLHHIPPEEDDKATRTLFVGNLEVNITEPELRRIFERYGVVEDIDIKRPPPGQGNAYAFVKFLNLDMAHKSKVELSGQYIGKFQCKIGYGKPIPTTRIWVGGLGPWTSLSHLEREFDRFGAIKKIDFVKGDNHAYILYDSIDAAQAACKEMRGFPLGGPTKRLRVDFADAGPYSYHQTSGSARPQPTAYAAEEDSYYRRRIDHEHLSLRGTPADPYYYGNSRDPEYRWTSSGGYGPSYDPYYERSGRSRIHDDWTGSGYERDRHHQGHDYASWGRDYPNWRDGVPSRDWAPGEPRRKRPRSPDDPYDAGLPSRGGPSETSEGSYRRYPRQRTSPEVPSDTSPVVRRRRSPSVSGRGYRSRDGSRERDASPPGRPSGSGMRDRGRSHSMEVSADGAERDRSSRFPASSRDETKNENGRSRDPSLGAASSSPSATTALLLPEAQAERLVNATTINEVARILPCSWQGGLVLKNSYFPIRMHACEGDVNLVELLSKGTGSNDGQILRITQRLRLEQPKLDDVSKRLIANSFCVLLGLALSGEDQTQNAVGVTPVQQRPLRNLVSYLKQKEAAGVIGLSSSSDVPMVLYVFPPCRFSQDRMRRAAPALTDDGFKEDHLMIVVARGGI